MSNSAAPGQSSNALWRVVFDQSNAVLVTALSAESARLEARLSVWLSTGRMLPVERVEKA